MLQEKQRHEDPEDLENTDLAEEEVKGEPFEELQRIKAQEAAEVLSGLVALKKQKTSNEKENDKEDNANKQQQDHRKFKDSREDTAQLDFQTLNTFQGSRGPLRKAAILGNKKPQMMEKEFKENETLINFAEWGIKNEEKKRKLEHDDGDDDDDDFKKKDSLLKNTTNLQCNNGKSLKTGELEKKRKVEQKKLEAGYYVTHKNISEDNQNLAIEKFKTSLEENLSPTQMALLEKNYIALQAAGHYKVVLLEGADKGLELLSKAAILEYFSKIKMEEAEEVQRPEKLVQASAFQNFKVGGNHLDSQKKNPNTNVAPSTKPVYKEGTGNAALVRKAALFKKNQQHKSNFLKIK